MTSLKTIASAQGRRAGAVGATVVVLAVSACSHGVAKPARLLAPEGVGTISAATLAQSGIYLGPPGRFPAGTPSPQIATPPTTSVDGETVTPGTHLGTEREAAVGDPANGDAKIGSRTATATALATLAFVGAVHVGATILVEFDDIYTGTIATAWAVPLFGSEVISDGPAPTNGSPVKVGPVSTTAIIFVDAVTGKVISEVGYSKRASP